MECTSLGNHGSLNLVFVKHRFPKQQSESRQVSHSTEKMLTFVGKTIVNESQSESIQKLSEIFEKNKQTFRIYFTSEKKYGLIRQINDDIPRIAKVFKTYIVIHCPHEIIEIINKIVIEIFLIQSILEEGIVVQSITLDRFKLQHLTETIYKDKDRLWSLLKKKVHLETAHNGKNSQLHLDFHIEALPFYRFSSNLVFFVNKFEKRKKRKSKNYKGKPEPITKVFPSPEHVSPPSVKKRKLSAHNDFNSDHDTTPNEEKAKENQLKTRHTELPNDPELERNALPILQALLSENGTYGTSFVQELEIKPPPIVEPLVPQNETTVASFFRFHHYLEQTNDSQSLEFLLTIFEKNIPIDLVLFMHYADPLVQKKMREMVLEKLNNLKEIDNFYDNPDNIPPEV